MNPGFSDYLGTWLLKVLPQHRLAAMMYWLTRNRWPPLKDLLIRQVVRRYKVNLFEAANPDPASYACFNDFFTRALRQDARQICVDPDEIACPVDGSVSQAGLIENNRLIQAKNHDYGLQALLGGDSDLAGTFSGGSFATIYLSPRDYHRIHMPLTGRLRQMMFVPGKLFSVSDATTQIIPNLFAINERTICLFETDTGPMAVILVGAIFVGSMETVWEGEIQGNGDDVSRWDYRQSPEPVVLEKGEELGRFNMGSTVILLFPEGSVQLDSSVVPGAVAQVGESIGRIMRSAG